MHKVLAAAFAAAFVSRAAIAQAPAPSRFEIMAGVNLAQLTTSADNTGDVSNRAGLVAGVGLIKPLAPSWSFQPELTYSMKGSKASDAGTTGTLKLSYIEMPLLLRYDIGSATSGAYPFIHAGPALALKLSCNFEGTDGTFTVSGSCGDAQFGGGDAKTFDLGFMFGGGLAFRHLDHVFSIGVRYNLGLLQVGEDAGSDAKNRVLSIVGTFEWPWGK
ncbi:MAG: PorT family protein [Acidobacteria bacterium]|nr:PorT family protein [Acidobacteriota bacterium]